MNKFTLYIKKEDGNLFKYGIGSVRYIYGLIYDYIQLHNHDEVEFKIKVHKNKEVK